MIGNPAPKRRRYQLRYKEGCDDHPDRRCRSVELQCIERDERKHHRSADHIDRGDGNQNQQALELIGLSRHKILIILFA